VFFDRKGDKMEAIILLIEQLLEESKRQCYTKAMLRISIEAILQRLKYLSKQK